MAAYSRRPQMFSYCIGYTESMEPLAQQNETTHEVVGRKMFVSTIKIFQKHYFQNLPFVTFWLSQAASWSLQRSNTADAMTHVIR